MENPWSSDIKERQIPSEFTVTKTHNYSSAKEPNLSFICKTKTPFTLSVKNFSVSEKCQFSQYVSISLKQLQSTVPEMTS